MENSSQGWIHYSSGLGSVQWWINRPFYDSHLSFFMIGSGLFESFFQNYLMDLIIWMRPGFIGTISTPVFVDHCSRVELLTTLSWFGLWNSCTAIHSFKKEFTFSLRQLNKALQEDSIAANLPLLNILKEWTWSIPLSGIHVLTTKHPKYI